MAYTTPRTYVAQEIHTAAHHNTYERDNIAWIATDSPTCRAYNNAAISTGSGSYAALTLNAERFDNASMHSTSSNTSRITVPTGGEGKYLLGGVIEIAANGTGNNRAANLQINGTTGIGQQHGPVSGGANTAIIVLTVYAMAVADYAELRSFQDSGGNLNVTGYPGTGPEFYAFWFRN